MKYKVTKLDKRYNGFYFYKYSVTPVVYTMPERARLLVELRNWCWSTYGPSAELKWTQRGDLWAWDTEFNNNRIYLKSDAELTLFKLKFEVDN